MKRFEYSPLGKESKAQRHCQERVSKIRGYL